MVKYLTFTFLIYWIWYFERF